MQEISTQKKAIEQKKQRLLQQENVLKLKERKARTRSLIEIGGLAAKAEIEHLPPSILLGGFLFLKSCIEKNSSILAEWEISGSAKFASFSKQRIPVILKFVDKPEPKIQSILREAGLKWNALRQEWYGYTTELETLQKTLSTTSVEIQVL
jgi:hypothetical protein